MVQSYHFDIQRLIDSFLCPFLSSVQIKISLVDTSKLRQIRWRYKLTYLKNDETIKKSWFKNSARPWHWHADTDTGTHVAAVLCSIVQLQRSWPPSAGGRQGSVLDVGSVLQLWHQCIDIHNIWAFKVLSIWNILINNRLNITDSQFGLQQGEGGIIFVHIDVHRCYNWRTLDISDYCE